MVTSHCVVHSINILVTIKPTLVQCILSFHGFHISIGVPFMNVIHIGSSYNCKPIVTLFSNVSHQILFVSASLMHDAMKSASSHNVNFDQFHIKASCMVTLSCFIYRMKFKRFCEGDNFVDLLKQIKVSFDRLKKLISSLSLNLINKL